MKILFKIIFLSSAVVVLTGCSLIPSSSDGGVFRSDDGGKNFAQKVTINDKTKISGVDVLSLAVNPHNGNEVYIGTKASGILKTTDAGEKWQPLKVAQSTPGKVYSVAIDSSDPRILYVAAVIDNRGKILKSTDDGASWKDVYTEPSSGSLVLALAINPLDSKKIYAGTTKGHIIFSDNGGDTWSSLYQAKNAVLKIAVDYSNPNLAYFAVFNGTLLRTRDGGKTFEDLAEKNILNRETGLEKPTAITIDQNQANWVYAGTTTGLFRSKDGGENWELMKKILNMPKDNAIREIAVNPQNSDEIIYGAAQVFYKSVDGGQSWATVQFGGSRSIEAISYNKQNPGMIYVGMNKR